MSTPELGVEGSTSFQEWLTTKEIWGEKLPGMPTSLRGINLRLRKIKKEHFHRLVQVRVGRTNTGRVLRPGFGQATLYHYSCLPVEAIAEYEARHRPARPIVARVSLGAVLLTFAVNGQVRAFIVQEIMADPGISVARLRDRCLGRFGATIAVAAHGMSSVVRMPSRAAFQELVQSLRTMEGTDAR